MSEFIQLRVSILGKPNEGGQRQQKRAVDIFVEVGKPLAEELRRNERLLGVKFVTVQGGADDRTYNYAIRMDDWKEGYASRQNQQAYRQFRYLYGENDPRAGSANIDGGVEIHALINGRVVALARTLADGTIMLLAPDDVLIDRSMARGGFSIAIMPTQARTHVNSQNTYQLRTDMTHSGYSVYASELMLDQVLGYMQEKPTGGFEPPQPKSPRRPIYYELRVGGRRASPAFFDGLSPGILALAHKLAVHRKIRGKIVSPVSDRPSPRSPIAERPVTLEMERGAQGISGIAKNRRASFTPDNILTNGMDAPLPAKTKSANPFEDDGDGTQILIAEGGRTWIGARAVDSQIKVEFLNASQASWPEAEPIRSLKTGRADRMESAMMSNPFSQTSAVRNAQSTPSALAQQNSARPILATMQSRALKMENANAQTSILLNAARMPARAGARMNGALWQAQNGIRTLMRAERHSVARVAARVANASTTRIEARTQRIVRAAAVRMEAAAKSIRVAQAMASANAAERAAAAATKNMATEQRAEMAPIELPVAMAATAIPISINAMAQRRASMSQTRERLVESRRILLKKKKVEMGNGKMVEMGKSKMPARPLSKNPDIAIRAILFDLDGVLSDSEALHRKTFNALFERFGVKISEKYWLTHYTGTGSRFIIEDILKKNKIREPVEKLMEERAQLFLNEVQAGRIPAVPGSQKLVDWAKKNGLKVAVASGGHRLHIKRQLGALGLSDMPFVGLEDTARQKPNPDIFLAAALKIGAKPSECLVIEDSGAGLKAAKAAGMRCILMGSHHPAGLRKQATHWAEKISDEHLVKFLRALAHSRHLSSTN